MTRALYDLGRESHLRGEIAAQTDNIRWVLVDTADYTLSLATDQFLSDIPTAAQVATSPNLTGKTTTAGVFDADDTTFTAVTGDVAEALVLYQDTGTPSTSRLILFVDEATGLPVQPNTGDIAVVHSNAAERIYRL